MLIPFQMDRTVSGLKPLREMLKPLREMLKPLRRCFFSQILTTDYMGVEPKIGVFLPPKSSIFNRVFHYFHHPFRGTPIFGNTHILLQYLTTLKVWF